MFGSLWLLFLIVEPIIDAPAIDNLLRLGINEKCLCRTCEPKLPSHHLGFIDEDGEIHLKSLRLLTNPITRVLEVRIQEDHPDAALLIASAETLQLRNALPHKRASVAMDKDENSLGARSPTQVVELVESAFMIEHREVRNCFCRSVKGSHAKG